MRVTSTFIVAVAMVLVASIAYAQGPLGEPLMLADQVASGQLPPMSERLPAEPLIAPGVEVSGKYGGTLQLYHSAASSWNEVGTIAGRITPVVTESGGGFRPFLARDFALSEDGKTITLWLREGLRWSDGTLHTADDYVYWYEEVLLNKDLTPQVSPTFAPGGEVMLVEALDDYTVTFSFAIPNPNFLVQMAINGGSYYQPQQYMKRFHAEHASEEDLALLVASAGVTDWVELYTDRANELGWNSAYRPAEAPTLAAYKVANRGVNTVTLDRNPYFWMVDQQGNQLPYIDRLHTEQITNAQVRLARAVNGEFDVFLGGSADLPLLIQNEAQGDYRTLHWSSVYNEYVLFPNQTHVNDQKRELLQEPDFRRALSLAIDRNEINEVVYLGLGTPMQAAPSPGSAFYSEAYASAYADYDPAEANRLLDELGFERGANGIRRDSYGNPITLQIEVTESYAPEHVQASELVVDYWKALGIDANYQLRSQELFVEINRSSDFDVRTYALVTEPVRWRWLLREWVPTEPVWSGWSTLWSEYYVSNGTQGMEPPPRIAALYDLHETWHHDPSEATRDAALDDILGYQAENINLIGTVGYTTYPLVVSNDLHNVPAGLPWFWDTGMFMGAWPWTWTFE